MVVKEVVVVVKEVAAVIIKVENYFLQVGLPNQPNKFNQLLNLINLIRRFCADYFFFYSFIRNKPYTGNQYIKPETYG